MQHRAEDGTSTTAAEHIASAGGRYESRGESLVKGCSFGAVSQQQQSGSISTCASAPDRAVTALSPDGSSGKIFPQHRRPLPHSGRGPPTNSSDLDACAAAVANATSLVTGFQTGSVQACQACAYLGAVFSHGVGSNLGIAGLAFRPGASPA